MGDNVVNLIVLGVMSWTTTFLLIRKLLFSKRSFKFCKHIVSTIHAILAVILASLSLDWSCPLCSLPSNLSPKQKQALGVTVSYLIYDLICCLFDERVGLDKLVHHLVCIVGIGAGFVYRKCGPEIVATLFITEISGPFLHARELIKELGYRDTNLNLAADISYSITFSVARMVVGPYLVFSILFSNNPIIIKAMTVGLVSVSVFWFYKIAMMVKYKLTKRVSSSLHTEKQD